MKRTILFLEQQSWRAGAQRVLDSVLGALADDFNVLVAFPDDGPYAEELRSRGIETVNYPLGRYRSGNKSFSEKVALAVRSGRCAVRISRLVRDRAVSLIYINAPRALPAGALAARATGTPAIFHLHRTLTNKTDLFVVAKAAAHVSRIIACSQAAAVALSAAAPRLAHTTQVVYNPAPDGDTRPIPSPSGLPVPMNDRPVVGLVGRITPQKGQMLLLRAAKRLKDEWPDIQIVLVGASESGNPDDANYLNELHSVVQALGLERNVRFAGYQNDPSPYYGQFDVLAAPSLDEGEGLPMVVLEAAARRVPAVASNVGGMSEVICDGSSGLLVAPGDSEALAAALKRVLLDFTLRRRLGDAALRLAAQRFSPASFRNHIRRIVNETCSTTAGGPACLHPERLAERTRPTKA